MDDLDQSGISIIELSPNDWWELLELRLRSLKQEPIAFEDPIVAQLRFAARSEQEWRDILSGKLSGGRKGKSFHVFAQDTSTRQLVGMVSAIVPDGRKPDRRAMATVQHMFVDQRYRGEGIGGKLLSELLRKLKTDRTIALAELWVVTTQLDAIRLYRKHGFTDTNDVKHNIQRAGASCSEQQMIANLRA